MPDFIRSHRRHLPLLTVIWLLALPAAGFADHHRCPAGQISARVQGLHRCLNSFRAATPGMLLARSLPQRWSRAAQALLHARWFGGFAAGVTRQLARLDRFPIPGQPDPWTDVRAISHTRRARVAAADPSAGHPTLITDAPPGGLDPSGTWYPMPGGPPEVPGATVVSEAQPYPSSEGLASGARTRSEIRKGTTRLGVDADQGAYVLCPDRAGSAPGAADFSESKFASHHLSGHLEWSRETFITHADFTAHTNDRAQIVDYDAELTLRLDHAYFDGRSVQRSGADVHISLHHVPMSAGIGAVLRHGVGLTAFTADAHGGTRNPENAAELASIILRHLHEHLVAAEQGWTRWRECLTLQYTPPAYTFAPGESHPVQALVSSKRTGTNTYTMRLKASPPESYTVSPADDVQGFGTPATFTLTAPARVRHQAPLSVSGLSRQGSVSGLFDPVLRAPLTVTFALRSTAEMSYQFDHIAAGSGTYTEHRTVSVAASVPLGETRPGVTASGSGPLTWAHGTSWSTDVVATNTGQATCTIDFADTMPSTQDGTLLVKGLTVGDPRPGAAPDVHLDLILSGLAQTWHEHETLLGGSCPVFDSDRTDHLLEDQLAALHSQAGDTALNQNGDDPVELILDHGWQAGTGAVIATRTLTGDLAAPFPTADGTAAPAEHFVETVTISAG